MIFLKRPEKVDKFFNKYILYYYDNVNNVYGSSGPQAMRPPAKVLYACRAVLELALRYKGERPVRIGHIAKAQNIPKNFLLQLMMRLKGAGIVHSERGMNGGYFLARRPAQISLGEVIRAVDENIFSRSKRSRPGDVPGSILLRIWDEANGMAADLLDGETLEDVLRRCKREPINYQI